MPLLVSGQTSRSFPSGKHHWLISVSRSLLTSSSGAPVSLKDVLHGVSLPLVVPTAPPAVGTVLSTFKSKDGTLLQLVVTAAKGDASGAAASAAALMPLSASVDIDSDADSDDEQQEEGKAMVLAPQPSLHLVVRAVSSAEGVDLCPPTKEVVVDPSVKYTLPYKKVEQVQGLKQRFVLPGSGGLAGAGAKAAATATTTVNNPNSAKGSDKSDSKKRKASHDEDEEKEDKKHKKEKKEKKEKSKK